MNEISPLSPTVTKVEVAPHNAGNIEVSSNTGY